LIVADRGGPPRKSTATTEREWGKE